MQRWLIAILFLALVTAGCVSCAPAGPPVTARNIGSGADQSGGWDDYTFTIRVLDEPGGPPLAGAGVVLYWEDIGPEDFLRERGGQVEVVGGPHGGRVVVNASDQIPTPRDDDTLRLRTGSDGTVQAEVPANTVVGLVVAKDGYTEEWYPSMASGDDGGSDTLEVPLYKQRLNTTVEGTWGPGGASTGFLTSNNYLWQAELVPFGGNEEAKRGYAERMVSLRAELTWENGLQGGGDLAIGIGPANQQPTYLHDETNDVSPGQHGEAFALNVGQLHEYELLGKDRAYIGPASDSGYVGPMGLPYTLTVEATFDPAIAKLSGCLPDGGEEGSGAPGASVPVGPALPLVALAGAALVLAARRQT